MTDAAAVTAAVKAARESGPPVVVATVVGAPEGGEPPVGAKLLLRPDGSTLGTLGGGALAAAALADAREAFRRHGVRSVFYAEDASRLARPEGAAFQVMFEVHEPPATLVIVGGGHIGRALATLGDLCGFSVVVIDDRPEYADPERFPEADRVICGGFEETLREFPIDASTYIVTVTRGHRQDETSLRVVAGSPAAYVGMIGSKRRATAVLKHLLDEGLDAAAAERVRTPIGLDIGAETPEEIAVAIMAEMVLVRRGGSGRPLRDVKRGAG